MAVTFSLNLPLPPSSNHMFATDFKTKRRFTTKEYRAWKKRCAEHVMDAWDAQGQPKIERPYSVHITLNLNHQADIANREKAITDLLVATIPGFPGDQWVNRLVIERDRSIKAAHVVVETMGECL